MKTELVRIGNSRGIRIPKPLIEQCGLRDVVELRVEKDRLIVSRVRRAREGWAEAFRAAGAGASDELLLEKLPANDFDSKEWKW
jgi:antitoxin MazE